LIERVFKLKKEQFNMKYFILERCAKMLKERNFNVEVFIGFNTCLDIVAKKESSIYFIKILYNIDALRLETAKEILRLAFTFDAIPIIIGHKTKREILKDGIAYERFNIIAFSLNTFKDFIEGKNPVAKYFKGKLSTKIDYKRLNDVRKKLNYSLAKLAEKLNISRNALHKYEKGKNPSLEVALNLEKILKCKLIKGITIASKVDECEDFSLKERDALLEKLSNYVKIKTFAHAPFKAFSNKISLLIDSSMYKNFERKILKLEKSKRVLEAKSLLLVKKSSHKKILSTPVLQEDELDSISNDKDLEKLIKERESV